MTRAIEKKQKKEDRVLRKAASQPQGKDVLDGTADAEATAKDQRSQGRGQKQNTKQPRGLQAKSPRAEVGRSPVMAKATLPPALENDVWGHHPVCSTDSLQLLSCSAGVCTNSDGPQSPKQPLCGPSQNVPSLLNHQRPR